MILKRELTTEEQTLNWKKIMFPNLSYFHPYEFDETEIIKIM